MTRAILVGLMCGFLFALSMTLLWGMSSAGPLAVGAYDGPQYVKGEN